MALKSQEITLVPFFNYLYDKIKNAITVILYSHGVQPAWSQFAHPSQQKLKYHYNIGLKADPDEKPYSASLPVLIRSLRHRCHPPCLTRGPILYFQYTCIDSDTCSSPLTPALIVWVHLLFLRVCDLHSHASNLCGCTVTCVHLSALILSLVAYLLYPETKRETLAPPLFTYGNSPLSPTRLLAIPYLVSHGLLYTSSWIQDGERHLRENVWVRGKKKKSSFGTFRGLQAELL